MLLCQYLNTVQIRSRFGCHLVTLSNTLQIRSRFRCHSVTHSNYSLDTIQIRTSFCHSFKIRSRYDPDSDVIMSLIQIHFRYAPDTDAILAIIQFQLIDTIQQSPLDGIFKPISTNICYLSKWHL